MSNRVKVHRNKRVIGRIRQAEKLARDLKREDDLSRLSNRHGGGLLPSQLGWGQHKTRKSRVTLFDPFRGGRP